MGLIGPKKKGGKGVWKERGGQLTRKEKYESHLQYKLGEKRGEGFRKKCRTLFFVVFFAGGGDAGGTGKGSKSATYV